MGLLILKTVAMIIIPIVFTVLLTRVTFNEWIGLLIAVGFVGGVFGDVLKIDGEYHPVIVVAASVALFVGFALSVKLNMTLTEKKNM